MSGIRAHDPELLELGLTLPGFVSGARRSPRCRAWACSTWPRARRRDTTAVLRGRGRRQRAGARSTLRPGGDQHVLGAGVRGVRHRRPAARGRREGGDGRTARHACCRRRPPPHADYVIVGEGENVWPRGRATRPSDASRRASSARRTSRPSTSQRPARAALRPARRSAVQPLHRADVARLSVAVRLLRVQRDARPAVPQAAAWPT